MNKQEMIIRGVVKDVGFSTAGSVIHSPGTVGIRTKVGGYILAKSGLRIKAK